jgi:predicted enzyme related to lactoylglutathione lyase
MVTMYVEGLGWAGVLTEDLEAALNFFSETLGLPLEYRDEEIMLAHFWLKSGQLFEVYGPSNRQRKEKYRWFNGPALGFEVDDIELARAGMIARGARFVTEIETWEDEAYSMFLGPEDKLLQIQLPGRRPSKEATHILGFSWAGVVMKDFDGAVRFFTEVMEMPLAQRDDDDGFAHFQLPAGHLFEVFGPNNKWTELMPHLTIGFEVEDVWQTRAELEKKGVEFIGKVEVIPADGAFTYFRGPDSYPYEIWKPG